MFYFANISGHQRTWVNIKEYQWTSADIGGQRVGHLRNDYQSPVIYCCRQRRTHRYILTFCKRRFFSSRVPRRCMWLLLTRQEQPSDLIYFLVYVCVSVCVLAERKFKDLSTQLGSFASSERSSLDCSSAIIVSCILLLHIVRLVNSN